VFYLSSSIAPFLPCFRRVTHNLFSSCRDDEEPPTDTTATPLIPPIVYDEPPAQEIAHRVTRASVKKVPAPQNLKRLKKAKETDVSLEAHASTISPSDVSNFC
jgi:hypothetical protein